MTSMTLDKQRGVSLGALLTGLVIVGALAIFGMKLIPTYMEYLTIKKAFVEMAGNPDVNTGGAREVAAAFDKYVEINDIKSITADDIDIDKSSGAMVLSADYSVKVPLAGNVSLEIDFHPTSATTP